jgi:hypothetical protein
MYVFSTSKLIAPVSAELLHPMELPLLEPGVRSAIAPVARHQLSRRRAIVDIAKQSLHTLDPLHPPIQCGTVQRNEQFQRVTKFLRGNSKLMQLFWGSLGIDSHVSDLEEVLCHWG